VRRWAILVVLVTALGPAAPSQAGEPRMRLVIGEARLEGDGSQCTDGNKGAGISKRAEVITETDVAQFRPTGGLMALDGKRFSRRGVGDRLVERCFTLSIDGKLVGRGHVQWVDTPRLTGFPILELSERSGIVRAQFLSGNHGNIRPLHEFELIGVLGGKPHPPTD
jgi:hypothetical protein